MRFPQWLPRFGTQAQRKQDVFSSSHPKIGEYWLIPGIHYFDAHRLQPLLLQAPALQIQMRESPLVGPEGAGEQVDDPSSDEEQDTTASGTEAESEDDDEATPPEETMVPANPTGHG